MLSVFPDLLAFSLLGATFLRVAAGIFFLLLASQHLAAKEAIGGARLPLVGAPGRLPVVLLSIIEAALGILLIVGLFTQVVALLGMIGAIKLAIFGRSRSPLAPHTRGTYLLLGAICLSLMLTGAGAFAFDLPL